MSWKILKDKCVYAFLPEMEPLFGVSSLLKGEPVHSLCSEIYGKERVTAWKKRYRFLFETFAAVEKIAPFSLFDFLLDVLDERFTTEGFRRFLLSLPPEELAFRQLDWNCFGEISREDICLAMEDEEALSGLYERVAECSSFLAFSSFLRQNRRYVEEFFALAAELSTPVLKDVLGAHSGQIDAFRSRISENLTTMDGLECSQVLMGKSFRNRGPFNEFIFLPSLLLPCASLRFFSNQANTNKRQILFCSIRDKAHDMASTVATLKLLGDETRYKILALLAGQGPVRGQELVSRLGLAPSTISHHMTALKECGLITEEPVKTAKYYGLAHQRIEDLLQAVAEDLKQKAP